MRQMAVRCTVVCMTMCGAAIAQNPASVPSGPAAEVQRSYATVKENILKSAGKMPAADYTYKPVADVRTYARVLNHVTEAQLRSCGAVIGPPQTRRPKFHRRQPIRTPIVTALKASFAECDKALSSLTNGDLQDVFTLPQGQRSRVGLVVGNGLARHGAICHVGALPATKGIAPPSSEK